VGSHSIIHTEKQKNPCDLDLWPTTLTLNRVLKVVEVHVHAKFHQVQRFMSYQQCTKFQTTLRLDREYLWNGSSNQQVEISIMNSDFSHIWWKQFGELWSTNEKWLWPLTVKLNRFLQVIEVHVHAKFHQAKCSGSWVIVFTNFFALSRNGKDSENPVLWPWPLTYDLEILWVSSSCQGTCSRKISSS